ncbi:MAG: cytochrome c maturation protein CcmE [Bacteroidetes bacterium]|nr:cytochrome c maturation protein CcmE [Bacteroidota bacterium]MCY4204444.1 cytochrome c maturation protein CcmE [Bacteroidota bacterium]
MLKPRTIVSLIALLGFGSLLLFSFGERVSGYTHFSEAEASGSDVHVIGYWVQPETAHYSPEENLFTFHMKDEEGTIRKVLYRDTKPASFENAEKLVVAGRVNGDVFEAKHILMKCPSKYSDTNSLEQLPPS